MTEFNDINLPADFDDLSKHAPLLEKLRGKGDGFVVPGNYFSDAAELSVNTTQLLGKVGTESGFSVPENYFEELAERIISVSQLMALKNDSSFTVPEGYFEKLTDEIVSLVNLSSLKNLETFDVPEGYFSELDETLKTSIALDNLKQDEGFTVPEGYFGKLGDSILSRIAVEELNTGSDSDVPEGYFDTLADRIADRIAKEEKGDKDKNVERGRIIVFAEVLKRYARPASIAASIALVIGVSIWFFNRSNGISVDKNPIVKNIPQPKQQLQPNVIPQPKQDSLVAPNQIIASTNIDSSSKPVKHISYHPVNPAPQVVVKDQNNKVDKNDVMDQVDLIDVNAIADYVSAQPTEMKNQDDKFLNESMKEYLLNDDADPGAYINNEQDQQ